MFTASAQLSFDDLYTDIERALSVFEALGAAAIDFDDSRALVLGLFVQNDDLQGRLTTALAERSVPVVRIDVQVAEAIDDAVGWRGVLRPLDFGRLLVVPKGVDAHASSACTIEIDSSGAFGSGLHPTTVLCLERVIGLSPVRAILDVGTGTGILALASLRLGTESAIGVEIDDRAIELARKNAEANNLELELRRTLPEERQFPLVVANILPAPLIELAPSLVRALAHQALLVLSGIHPGKISEVKRTFCNLGLHVVGEADRAGWALIELEAPW